MKKTMEEIWVEIDQRLYGTQEDHFLSEIEDWDCPCPVCNISEEEKKKAEEQMEEWIDKWT